MYLSPDLVEQLARNPSLLQLGGELREITVMFTDVRGFTTISEQFDPHGLTRFMNRFLTPMTDLILARGERSTSTWATPSWPSGTHRCRRAPCRARLRCGARHAGPLLVLNEEWKKEAEAEGRKHIPVNIGVGLNTVRPRSAIRLDPAFHLFVPRRRRESRSRLEGQCKTYGVGIIIGRKTREAVEDYATLEIDLITVKGKTEPERIHALLAMLTSRSRRPMPRWSCSRRRS